MREKVDPGNWEIKLGNSGSGAGHFVTLIDNRPGGRYLFGDTITYADCALFHVLDAAMSQFPDAWDEPSREKLRATLEPYMKLITMHVTLGAYLKADDRAPWAGDSMM